MAIVGAAASPAGAILIDPLHLERTGGTAREVADIPRDLRPYAQFCDAWIRGPGAGAQEIDRRVVRDAEQPAIGIFVGRRVIECGDCARDRLLHYILAVERRADHPRGVTVHRRPQRHQLRLERLSPILIHAAQRFYDGIARLPARQKALGKAPVR